MQMTLKFLAEHPDIAAHLALVAFVFFLIGLMVGDCIGFRAGIRIFSGRPDREP